MSNQSEPRRRLPCADWCLICPDLRRHLPDENPCDHCPDCNISVAAADDATWD